MFKKIIDDIGCFDEKVKMVRLAGTGEPLINRDLPKMIMYAKQKNVSDFIEIITNASLLDKKLSDELIESGVDRIKISIEDLDKDGYKRISNVDIDFDKVIENIKYLYENKKQCEIYIKTVDATISNEEDKIIVMITQMNIQRRYSREYINVDY